MSLILKELEIERALRGEDSGGVQRAYYELDEMTPVESTRHNEMLRKEEEYAKIESEAAQRRRNEFLHSVTDKILSKLDDLGVTVFMPHVVSRDLFKKVSEMAEKCQLTARDKKAAQIRTEHLEAMLLDCENPLAQHVIDHILDKDVFMVCWKLTDMENPVVESHLADFVDMIWKKGDECDQAETQSLLKAFSKQISIPKSKEDKESEAAESSTTVTIPPVWAPANKRANAMLIYLYFRNVRLLTGGFFGTE